VRYPEAVRRVVRLILGRLTLAIAAAFVALFLFAYVAHDSFPSGHAFFSLTIYGMLAYLLSRDAPPRRRRQRWGATVVAILLVGFSRVFLGVHFPSDVVAGFLVALPWLWDCLALPQALRWVRLWRQR
jgi:membrane-associated phospholipid phosphatase